MFPVIELPPGGVGLQWVYNRVRDHLLKQKVRAHDGSSCVYRGPDNTACAAGCLIRDDLYDPIFEGHSVGYGWEGLDDAITESLNLKLGDNITPENKDLLLKAVGDLQVIHDRGGPDTWNEQLRRFAEIRGLVP